MYEWHGFGGGIMWIFWILIIAALVWFVVSAARRTNTPPYREKSAREILEERYARGEIDRDEFELKKKDLSN